MIIIFLFEGHNQGKGFENQVCVIKKKVVILRTISKLLTMLTIVVIHSDSDLSFIMTINAFL